MGFLDKVKNMFTEEIEEAPIKKDVIQVEIPAPVKEEKKEEVVVAESEVIKKEEKITAPVFFDDKDFANLERKEDKVIPKVENKYKAKPEEKKVFKPTPIISPIYGVLDKNYHKEDITPKRRNPVTTEYEKASLDIDKVRKKAYGTLEDDLETIIPSDDYEIIEEKDHILEDISPNEIFDDLMDPDYEPRFAEKEKPVAEDDVEIDVLENLESETLVSEPEIDIFEEMHQDITEEETDLSESDLFNLIDSMYDKKDDE